MDDFGTVLTCMDGRIQRKVADYLLTSFGVRHLDTITTAGMVRHISEHTDQTRWILNNLDLSVSEHSSRHIGITAHSDCKGNPVPDDIQKGQLTSAVRQLGEMYREVEVMGLWIDRNGIVSRGGK